MRGNIGAIVLIVVGSLFLLSNLGLLDVSIGHLVRTWWPLILILIGLSLLFNPRRK